MDDRHAAFAVVLDHLALDEKDERGAVGVLVGRDDSARRNGQAAHAQAEIPDAAPAVEIDQRQRLAPYANIVLPVDIVIVREDLVLRALCSAGDRRAQQGGAGTQRDDDRPD